MLRTASWRPSVVHWMARQCPVRPFCTTPMTPPAPSSPPSLAALKNDDASKTPSTAAPTLLYEAPWAKRIHATKSAVVTSGLFTGVGIPMGSLLGHIPVTSLGEMLMYGSLMCFGFGSTSLYHMFSKPYVLRMWVDEATKVVSVETLNVVASKKRLEYPLDDIEKRTAGPLIAGTATTTTPPFLKFQAKDDQFALHPDGITNRELLDKLTAPPETPTPRKSVPRKDGKIDHNTPMLGGKRLTLRFDSTGTATHEAVSRHDALKMVQEAAVTVADMYDPPTAASSRPTKGVVDIANIHMRDIRQLDNAFDIANKPCITVRQQGILVNADPIRAVITRDSCVVFFQDGADALMPELEANFKTHIDESSVHGFEFTALEAILATICTGLARDAAKALPLAKDAVDKIAQDASLAGELGRLLAAKNSMDQLNARVTGMRKAFVDILENEEDLRMMHLTKLYNDPSLAQDLFSFDSEELESLIEVYLQDIYDTQTQISLMLENLQNTRNIATLKLDTKRNYLLMVNLTLSLWTTLITVPTFVVGTFGMNLTSNLEEAPYLFYMVVGGCVLFPISVYRLVLRYFRERGIKLSWTYK
ncbi:Aste57867_12174 [Aphanomyces stellatus]|uniref:Magnesium transporter n=1 Tax=Aphanomyces stellatus TaxID=120398 RepID=A0A485KWV4_9STRA|nr:hypothetical protein As57867_012129 [Aphanomyces stellatus]VFT89028.1 Aste57867_12174 [Aphanomyces stellatus]